MKTMMLSAATALFVFPAAVQAQSATETAPPPVTVSGSVAIASDYRLRGISQSDEHMAVQGGITVSHESGLYVGTWASNLAGWGTFGGANMELDLIGGYKTKITEGGTLDVGAESRGGASEIVVRAAGPRIAFDETIGRALENRLNPGELSSRTAAPQPCEGL